MKEHEHDNANGQARLRPSWHSGARHVSFALGLAAIGLAGATWAEAGKSVAELEKDIAQAKAESHRAFLAFRQAWSTNKPDYYVKAESQNDERKRQREQTMIALLKKTEGKSAAEDYERAQAVLEAARQLHGLGFKIRATKGTRAFLEENGIPAQLAAKLGEERPNLVDVMSNGEIHLVVNTPNGKAGAGDDSYIRKTAIKYKIPYITTAAAAVAAARGIAASKEGGHRIRSLQEYHADLK